ncbi:MAG TPA: phage holin family protein [Patescibacteria group bacterium]|nr:phage holin family protein [Patescibacteria group bacterium]
MAENSPPHGILQSLRSLGRSGVEVLQNRLELAAVELEEQKLRLVRMLIFAGSAIFLANTAVLALSATIIVLAGAQARVAVLVGLTVFYTVAAIGALIALRKELRSAPPAFQDSIDELKKDLECLSPPARD